MFEQIIGNQQVKERLRRAVREGTVSHAYLFCGKKGIGKKTAAMEFARLITGGSEADIKVVDTAAYPVKTERKTTALPVEAVREFRKDAAVRPYMADRRVFIVPDADLMNASAQNALLKLFEEPPSFCVIILIGEKEDKLLPTIRSRASVVRFAPLSNQELEQYIAGKYGTVNRTVLRLAGGSIGTADSLLTDTELGEKLEAFCSLFGDLFGQDMAAVYSLASFLEKEKERVRLFMEAVLCGAESALLCNGEKDGTILFGQMTGRAAVRMADLVQSTIRALDSNANYNIAVNEFALNAWEAIHD